MKRSLVLLFAVFVVAACYKRIPPEIHTTNNIQTLNAPKDVVFQGVTKFFAINHIQIQTIEPQSGVIYAQTNFTRKSIFSDDFYYYADCGKADFRDKIRGRKAELNVLVEELEPNKSQVIITTNFLQTRLEKNLLGGYVPKEIECTSKGTLEDQILSIVSEKL